MNESTIRILDKIGIGIIVIDRQQKILVWNDWLVRYTQNKKEYVVGKEISEVVPCFRKKLYNDILVSALFQGQGRFCSGSLHPPFLPVSKDGMDNVRQNLIIDPVFMENDVFVVIQIIDVTAYQARVDHLITKMKTLEIVQDEMKETQKLNQQLALHDSLTGLPNRTLLFERMAWGIENAERNGDMIAVLFIDLDGFKEVNDTFGHDCGDSILKAVAARLKGSVRKNDTVARYGGDEFVIVLMQLKNLSDVDTIAEKIVQAFHAGFQINDCSFKITVSIGISLFPYDNDDINGLLKNADSAMYKVKKSSKNHYSFWNQLELNN